MAHLFLLGLSSGATTAMWAARWKKYLLYYQNRNSVFSQLWHMDISNPSLTLTLFFDMKYLSINGQWASSYGLIRARDRLIHTRASTPNWYYDSAPVQKLQTLQQVSDVIQDKSLFNMVWRTSASYQYKILLFSVLLIANNPAEELYSASLTQSVSQTGLKHSWTQSHQTHFLHPQNETATYCLFSKLITILPKHRRGWIRKLAPVKIQRLTKKHVSS